MGSGLQYAAFFGVFAVFALLEGVAPRDRSPTMRLWRWPSNVVLTAVNIAVLGALPVGIVAVADWAQGARFGLLHAIDVAPWVAFAIILPFIVLKSRAVAFAKDKR